MNKKYKVTLSGARYLWAKATIEAENPEQAEWIAMHTAGEMDWEGPPGIADVQIWRVREVEPSRQDCDNCGYRLDCERAHLMLQGSRPYEECASWRPA